MTVQYPRQEACTIRTVEMFMEGSACLYLSLTSAGRFLLRGPSNFSVTPVPFVVGFSTAAAAEASARCDPTVASGASTIFTIFSHLQQQLSGPVSMTTTSGLEKVTISSGVLQSSSCHILACTSIVSTSEPLPVAPERTEDLLCPVCLHVRSATVDQALSFGWLLRRDAWQRLRD